MIILTIISILLFNINCLTAGQWVTVDSNYANIYRAIDCIDSNTCLTIANYSGWGAFVRKTIDGGNIWSVLYDNSKESMGLKLNDLACPNDSLYLVACNNGKILRSVNGGKSWDTIKLKTDANLVRLFMMTDNFGCVLGNPNKCDFYVTQNKGQTWDNIRLDDSLKFYYAADVFITKDTIFNFLLNSQEGKYFLSYDYKSDRLKILECPKGISRLFFLDSDTGWGVGSYFSGSTVFSCIYKTTDRGSSWQTQIEKPGFHISDIKFFDDFSGIAVGHNQTVIRTTDGGGNWLSDSTYPPYANPLFFLKVSIPSRTRQYLIAHQGVVKRYDLTTSINNENQNDSEKPVIFPNPINRDLMMFKLILNTEFYVADYSLFDILGVNVTDYIKTFKKQYENIIEFELSNSTPDGIYYFILKSGKRNYTNKIIIY